MEKAPSAPPIAPIIAPVIKNKILNAPNTFLGKKDVFLANFYFHLKFNLVENL